MSAPTDWHDIGLLFGLEAIANDEPCDDTAARFGIDEPPTPAASAAFELGYMTAWQLDSELNATCY